MELKDYTMEDLIAELKRRTTEKRAKNASILRCRMCKHRGEVTYWGEPVNGDVGNHSSCRFFKTKNGKYYRCHKASELACKHFERKGEYEKN